MQYFLGKIVTILVRSTTLDFSWDDKSQYRHAQYFTGRLEKIDNLGVWLYDEQRKVKSYFFSQHIVGILEEQEVPQEHPLVQAALQKAEKQDEQKRAKKMEEVIPAPCQAHMAAIKSEPLTQLSIDKLGKVIKSTQEKLNAN
jgi:hypothetical protein